MFILIIVIITLAVLIPIMVSKKSVKMHCPSCGHTWEMSKRTYMTTPYAQRGVNSLFRCAKCGSEGSKSKKK